jgi:hypothetical protein
MGIQDKTSSASHNLPAFSDIYEMASKIDDRRRVSEFELLSTKVNLNGAALRLQMNDRPVLERIHLADDDSHADEPHIHKCSTWG